MRRVSLYILVLMTALISGCTKESAPGTDMGSESEAGSSSQVVHSCDPACLVHHAALEPTYYECGNVEYWQCPHCGARYSDSGASAPLEGFIYRMPTRFISDKEALRAIIGWDEAAATKGWISKIAEHAAAISLAAEVAGLTATVASIGVALASFGQSNEKLEKAIDEMSAQQDKTQEQAEALSQAIADLSASLKQTSAKIDELSTAISGLSTNVNKLVDEAALIDAKADKILSSIQNMDVDLHYITLLSSRHDDLMSLVGPAKAAIASIKSILAEDKALFASCADSSDSLSVVNLCMMDVYKAISSWGNSSGENAALASRLLSTYESMDGMEGSSYPEILRQYLDSHIAWEHHAFQTRTRYLFNDKAVSDVNYLLARMFYSACNSWDDKYRSQRLAQLDSAHYRMNILFSQDTVGMEADYAAYRLCNVTGKKFSTKAKFIDPKVFVENHVQVNGDNGEAVYYDTDNYTSLFGGTSDQTVTEKDIETVLQYFCGTDFSAENVFFSFGNGGLELEDNQGTGTFLIIPYTEYIGDHPFEMVLRSSSYGYDGITKELSRAYYDLKAKGYADCAGELTPQEALICNVEYYSRLKKFSYSNVQKICFTPQYYTSE